MQSVKRNKTVINIDDIHTIFKGTFGIYRSSHSDFLYASFSCEIFNLNILHSISC